MKKGYGDSGSRGADGLGPGGLCLGHDSSLVHRYVVFKIALVISRGNVVLVLDM
jgi:hypothetical protein